MVPALTSSLEVDGDEEEPISGSRARRCFPDLGRGQPSVAGLSRGVGEIALLRGGDGRTTDRSAAVDQVECEAPANLGHSDEIRGKEKDALKNCIGAIDGTHIRVKVSKEDVSRAFGVLKNMFPILAEMSRYDVETVSEIVLACCILHNFLVDFDPDEEIIAQVDRDLMNNKPDHGLANRAIARGEDGRRGGI
ncbi:hypothetical protein ZIOFF_062708 [Zingiber officinale]|uniref:DDE Tnp4 domain-containing protein n=1 Tax=Zingiber officinale TaxID=94328 RepID=A0A8J5KAW9_ZINOF|nr:hypothetical protein ZIOFF_062708 [Zingiber officinale]